MPTKEDRKTLEEAIEQKDSTKIRELLQRDDAKELLLMNRRYRWLPIHDACRFQLDEASLQLILDSAVKHGVTKQMFEEKTNTGSTCLHFACWTDLSTDSLRLLLEYLSKHADIKKVLEEKEENGRTCLHYVCRDKLSANSLRLLLEYLAKHADIKKMLEEQDNLGETCLHVACRSNLSIDSLRLLVSFFPSNESLQLVLSSKNTHNQTALDLAKTDEHKQLLQDPDCWRRCRYWLFCNYQDTFLNSLYPNSPEKTHEALKELRKHYVDDETLRKATLLQQHLVDRLCIIPDESAARQTLELEALTTIVLFDEDFHRDHIIRRENSEVQRLIADLQTQVLLSRDELDRQEFKKLIFDRLPITGPNKEAISILQENHVTKESFFLLDKDDLREMGVKIGPRKQLLQIIEQEIFRRNNLSARSDISSRPRSPGHTPRIDGVPPISLNASALIQQHQRQQQQQQQQLGNAQIDLAAVIQRHQQQLGNAPPLQHSASALIQRYQEQQLGNAPSLPTASKDSNSDEQRSFVATENSGTEYTAKSEHEA